LKERGKTIFFNSHLLPDVNEVCDRVGILNHGKLVAEEKVSAISRGGNYRDLEDYFLTMVEESEGKDLRSASAKAKVTGEPGDIITYE
jgi:ABC-2 type transport system ATP-binding protein